MISSSQFKGNIIMVQAGEKINAEQFETTSAEYKELLETRKIRMLFVDGPDRIGKTKATEGIMEQLSLQGYYPVGVSLPQYTSGTGEWIKDVLRDENINLDIEGVMYLFAMNRRECMYEIMKQTVEIDKWRISRNCISI